MNKILIKKTKKKKNESDFELSFVGIHQVLREIRNEKIKLATFKICSFGIGKLRLQ